MKEFRYYSMARGTFNRLGKKRGNLIRSVNFSVMLVTDMLYYLLIRKEYMPSALIIIFIIQ